MIIKIKSSKKAKDEFKSMQLKEQGHRCPLTGRHITMQTGVIDHDHTTGHIRAILTNGVNRAEGQINGALTKWAGMQTKKEKIDFLRALANYYEAKPLPFIYPTHKTDSEKRILKNKRARAAYAKSKGKK
jgi:hypothetical protein